MEIEKLVIRLGEFERDNRALETEGVELREGLASNVEKKERMQDELGRLMEVNGELKKRLEKWEMEKEMLKEKIQECEAKCQILNEVLQQKNSLEQDNSNFLKQKDELKCKIEQLTFAFNKKAEEVEKSINAKELLQSQSEQLQISCELEESQEKMNSFLLIESELQKSMYTSHCAFADY